MRRVSGLTLFFFALFSASSFGQSIDPAQQFRNFGNKMVEGTWHRKLPTNVEDKHSYQWALGNQYLIVYMWNKDTPKALAITGIDPETQLQTWWTFQDDGAVRITSVDVETITPTKDKVAPAGRAPAGAGTFQVSWKNKNTLEIIPEAGAKDEDGNDAEASLWERAAESDDLSWIDAPEPKEIPKQLTVWSIVTGQKWIDGVTPEGWEITGGSYGKWILGGKFHILTASTSTDIQTAWSHVVISGIDPESGRAASWEFTSSGARSKVKYNDEGTTIYGDNTLANGEKNTFEGHFTVDGDVLRYKSKIGKEGEEPLPYGWNYHNVD